MVRTLRMHLRKIATLGLLGVAHARSTVPRVPLPPNQSSSEAAPERDMRLVYLAVLPLVILVPLLAVVMVAHGDEESSPKRRRTEDLSTANDEPSAQPSTTQTTGGVTDKEPRVCSTSTQSASLGAFTEMLPHTVHNPRPPPPHQTVYEVLKCWIDRRILQNVWANKSQEYHNCASNEKLNFWNPHVYDRPLGNPEPSANSGVRSNARWLAQYFCPNMFAVGTMIDRTREMLGARGRQIDELKALTSVHCSQREVIHANEVVASITGMDVTSTPGGNLPQLHPQRVPISTSGVVKMLQTLTQFVCRTSIGARILGFSTGLAKAKSPARRMLSGTMRLPITKRPLTTPTISCSEAVTSAVRSRPFSVNSD